MEGHSQILLEATCPPHFCIFFFVIFVLLFFCLLLQLCFLYNKKKCKNDTRIKNRWKPTTRHIVCPVQNPPRVHSYHVDLFNLDTPSFVRGLSNPHIGHRPYLEKLKRTKNTYNNRNSGLRLKTWTFRYLQRKSSQYIFLVRKSSASTYSKMHRR